MRPRRALGEGGQGAVRAVPSTLVTGSGRSPRGRAPEEEEGWTGPSARREEGLERRAGGGQPPSNLDCEPGGGAWGRRGLRGGGSGPQPQRASGLRRGAPRGRCGPGRGGRAGRAEAPGGAAKVPGEHALVSQLPPRPPPPGWRRGGRGGRGTPLRVSSDISSGWEGSRCTAEPGSRARSIKEPSPASN